MLFLFAFQLVLLILNTFHMYKTVHSQRLKIRKYFKVAMPCIRIFKSNRQLHASYIHFPARMAAKYSYLFINQNYYPFSGMTGH